MKLYLKTKDFSVTGEEFELHRDAEMDMLHTQPRPADLNRYYESDDYISHTDSKTSFTDKLYQRVKRRNLKYKIQIVDNQAYKTKSLLDFGAGTGDFVLYAKQAGYQALGIEPSAKARKLADAKGISLLPDLDELQNQKFQVITLWHVLEHLPDLEKQIGEILSKLNPQGTLVVAVPNFKSFDAKYYGPHWAGFDVPRHLWHFSKQSIKQLFDRQGFEIVSIHPMLFDAFYVSMLSEKYRGNKLYLINAFVVGLWSNLKAMFSKEHSSLIYVLKKKNS